MPKKKIASSDNSKLQSIGNNFSTSTACADPLQVSHQVQPQINPGQNNIKIGDFVELEFGIAEIIDLKEAQAELLISTESSVCSVWRDLGTLQLVSNVEDQYGTWWQVGVNFNSYQTPIWHNPKLEVIDHECDEKYVVLERTQSAILVVREGLRPKRHGFDDEGWKIGCINPWCLELPADEADTFKAKGTKVAQTKTEELQAIPPKTGTQYIQLTLWDWLGGSESSYE